MTVNHILTKDTISIMCINFGGVFQVLQKIMDVILDILSDFFSAISVPSPKLTTHAFIVSLVFIPLSLILNVAGYSTIVSWQEAVTCSILMGVLVLSAHINKSTVSSLLSKIQSKFVADEEVDYDENSEEYEDAE